MKKFNKIGNKLIIAGLLLTLIPTLAYAKEDNFIININEKPIKMDKNIGYPFINEYNRTMVPIRVISENMGYKVDWNQENQIVTINNDRKNIYLKVGKNYSIIDGKEVKLDSEKSDIKTEVINDRTYVPLRFVSEEFGYKVDYNLVKGKHIINIYNKKEEGDNDGFKEYIVNSEDNNRSEKNYLKPKYYNCLGPVYEFNRNNPRLKNISQEKYKLNLSLVRNDMMDKLVVYDGTDLYQVNKNIQDYYSFSGKDMVDFGLNSINISNSKKEGYKKNELASFRVLYYELENGQKVQGDKFSIKGLTIDNKPYNLLGHKVTRVVMTNAFNCHEKLIINTDIQLPKTLDGLKEIKIN